MVASQLGPQGQDLVQISPEHIKAVLFDMDGVVTQTASVHFQAWKSTFDAFLQSRDGDKFQDFTEQDYLDYVDGKPREDGVHCFLESRKITLDGNDDVTEDSLAKAKDAEFMRLIHTQGVKAYDSTLALIQQLKAAGIKIALVTASKNGAEVLKTAQLDGMFDATVTGVDAANLHLKGKPAPDVFLEAAKRLLVQPKFAVVVEDAEAGVASGKAGHFGMVIGVARKNNVESLKEHGASQVVTDLAQVSVTSIDERGGKQDNAQTSPETIPETINDGDENWVIVYDHYDAASEQQRESLCALGNGKFFTRAADVSSTPGEFHYPGTYVTGGYNSVELQSKGLTFESEQVVNFPNWLFLSFRIDDDADWFSMDSVEIISYSKRLDLREGILYKDVIFKDQKGRQTRINEKRFVHMQYSHLGGFDFSITPLDWSGKLLVRSGIDGRIKNTTDAIIDPEIGSIKHFTVQNCTAQDDIVSMTVITDTTKFVVSQASRTTVLKNGQEQKLERTRFEEENFIAQDFEIIASVNETIAFQKIVTLYTSRDKGVYEPRTTALEIVSLAPSVDILIKRQIEAWKSLWQQYDVSIETTEEYAKSLPSLLLHLNSFHCLQVASTHTVDLDCGVPARSWTGEGYQGHVFWDDLFVFPFINLRMPNISAALLKYRYRRLNQARLIARKYGAKGACFPWQSASDGRERTADFWWMDSQQKWIKDYTHLELHVNGAIVYNVWQYFQVTRDTSFMYSYGTEIILEVARFFATLARYNPQKERYEINNVIGPDEFHNGYPGFKEPGVNNNTYTNFLAVWTIQRALQLLDTIPSDHGDHIRRRLEVTDEEITLWTEVSTKMFIPVMQNGIAAQFEGYENLQDFPSYKDGRVDHEAMLQAFKDNFGYLNQYKISKQADTLMLGYLFTQKIINEVTESLGYPTSCLDLRRLANYYIPKTSNESTLSRVAVSWVLSHLDRTSADDLMELQKSTSPEVEDEMKLDTSDDGVFYEALGSDYFNIASRGTTRYGIHMGAMAGTIDIVQRCYTGICTLHDVLAIDPELPREITRLIFNMRYRGQSLTFDIKHNLLRIAVKHSSAQAIKISYKEQIFELSAGDIKEIALTPSDRSRRTANVQNR
ncbi:MAG: beta-phosphoglucomutase family hydrolase [Candidatus Obscuribacterales bacterium]|nr:beta-phosphoglucomutase family hydrolase [Candidatus Obscuribacterales bacterium]